MGSIYRRKDSPWWWMKWRDAAGALHQQATRFRADDPAQEAEARKTLELLERRVEAERNVGGGVLTVQGFAATWLEGLRRRELESAGQYAQRLRDFVFPAFGALPIREVRPRHVRELVRQLREQGRLAPRTIRNVYAVVRGLFREAAGRELVDGSPCVLLRHELPPKQDRDPTWRSSAIFSRREVEQIISDERIPADRRALAAALLLAGPRIGEALEWRWSDYDAAAEPLGRLTVARSWSSKHRVVRPTKTRSVRQVPVHPTLAQVLARWRLSGWAALVGRPPREEDLLFPDASGGHRSAVVALRRFHRDLELIGLRARRQHDARRAFISLVQADGGRRELLEYVTHGPDQTVMDLYTTPPWQELCETVAKLRIALRGAREVTALPRAVNSGGSDGGRDEGRATRAGSRDGGPGERDVGPVREGHRGAEGAARGTGAAAGRPRGDPQSVRGRGLPARRGREDQLGRVPGELRLRPGVQDRAGGAGRADLSGVGASDPRGSEATLHTEGPDEGLSRRRTARRGTRGPNAEVPSEAFTPADDSTAGGTPAGADGEDARRRGPLPRAEAPRRLRSATEPASPPRKRGVADGRGGTRTLPAGGSGARNSPSSAGLAPDGLQNSQEQPAERSRAATLELLPPAGADPRKKPTTRAEMPKVTVVDLVESR